MALRRLDLAAPLPAGFVATNAPKTRRFISKPCIIRMAVMAPLMVAHEVMRRSWIRMSGLRAERITYCAMKK